MKKLLTLSALLFSALASFSQKFSYGVDGGVTIGALHVIGTETGVNRTTSSHVSVMIDAFADCEFHNFSIEPALTFLGKGGSVATDDVGGNGDFSLNYFEIPVNFLYHVKTPVGDVHFGAGPYFAFASSGKLSVAGPAGDDTEDATFGGSGDFASSETGINFLAGIGLNSSAIIRLNYNWGLSNILNQNGPEGGLGSFKTRTFVISAGFTF